MKRLGSSAEGEEVSGIPHQAARVYCVLLGVTTMSSIKNRGRDPKRTNDGSTVGEYALAGKPVRCPHCDGAHFKAGEAQLNTALATLLKLDWTDRSATVLICTSCGQIQWFEKQPSRID